MKYSHDIETLESEIFGEDQEAEAPESPDVEGEPSFGEDETPWREEISDPVMMTVTLEDGTEMECRVEGVFLEGEKEYIALETGQGEIQIMELGQGDEDEIQLLPVADEEEQERVVQAFIRLFGDPYDDLEGPEGDSPGPGESDEGSEKTDQGGQAADEAAVEPDESGDRAAENEKTERGNEDDQDKDREKD